jgi:phenylpropionate dioxygenase-like ring-hydroxylating dioxygenase large terminal subunit
MADLNPQDSDAEIGASVDNVMLRNAWYYALPSSDIRSGRVVHRTMLGEPVLIGRDADGSVFALKDTCPHRGTLLSHGCFDGREVECPYHGWRFATDGRCTAIPSQTATQRPQPGDIRAMTYLARETQGNIWIYFASKSGAERPSTPPPEVPQIGGSFKLHVSSVFDCGIDMAVSGLMDPAHGAFVHRSALWRTRKSIHEKVKTFSPISDHGRLGWRMERHRASSNSRAYRFLLGGTPETEITYTLPSVRVEHATTGRFSYCGLTACTPIDAKRTAVHHVMYWTVPDGGVLVPLIRLIASRFIDQDRRAVMSMAEGQKFLPATMLIRDADMQARWYFRLKREWLAAETEGRDRSNPIAPATLRWRS